MWPEPLAPCKLAPLICLSPILTCRYPPSPQVSSVSFVGLQLYWLSLFVRISLAESKRAKRKEAKKSQKALAEDA